MSAADRTVTVMNDRARELLTSTWAELGATTSLPPVDLVGEAGGLPSVYAVGDLATAMVSLASCAVSSLVAARTGEAAPPVTVDRRHAAVAFRSERYLAFGDGPAPSLWDPIAGDYRAADGWVRLHTNYAHHRAAALAALDVPEDRAAVATRVGAMAAEDVERLVVAAGGCAAKMRTTAGWAGHPQGQAVASEPLVARSTRLLDSGNAELAWEARATDGQLEVRRRPLAGIRVLDLTRVIAGPVCTRVLAAYGADVLRLDPPGFVESPVLLADVTQGKRRAWLDLRSVDGQRTFAELVASADLLVCGLRNDALEPIGLGEDRLRELNPALAQVYLDAYGWTGPWRERRGFDSLVQMSAGIAARGQEALGTEGPSALPAQALDHGAGYLLAAVCCRALTELHEKGAVTTARISLARIAYLLASQGDAEDPRAPSMEAADATRYLEKESSGIARVRVPGHVAGTVTTWSRPAGPLGIDAARFDDD